MVRGRLIVSLVLVAAFCASIAALVLDIRPDDENGGLPKIGLDLPGVASVAPTGFPGTMPPRAIPQFTSDLPSGVLNLTDWKLTLPAGDDDGDPLEVKQPELTRFRDDRYFHNDEVGDGVVFRAPVSGSTTSNSSYPRSELREMADGGKKEASWSGKSGTHAMTITQAITSVPQDKPEVVAGQIHDEEDDVVMVRLNGRRLFVEADGDDIGTLEPAYQLGTQFTVQFVVSGGTIRVTYNGTKSVGLKRSGSGYYFKAGCYTQSNEDGNSYGEVVISALTIQHS